MNWLKQKLNAIIAAVVALRDGKTVDIINAPPMLYCLICHSPTTWLVVSKVYLCANGHKFTPPQLGVEYPPLPPKPDIRPGDVV